MPRLSRFQIMQHVKPKIIKCLHKFLEESQQRYFTISNLQQILSENREKWMLPTVTTYKDFIKFLVEGNTLKQTIIRLPNGKKLERYTVETISNYELALSINQDSYLSHYTALHLHGLTINIPKNIYTNKEQIRKTHNYAEDLKQERINFAFSRQMRKTNQIAEVNTVKIYLVNGKNVDKYGLTTIMYDGQALPITNVERTLIDSCVRPDYVGGVQEIFEAFKLAKHNISVNKLLATLKHMDYVYPYHQALGFYLEKAGYEERLLELVEKIEIKYDFYLTYAMKEYDYSDRWRLFFPKWF